ncbi:amidohydrolase [Rubeoparvulum massiliense]|uniref:amidohydrolase n=1 Tax=Rubeoparvulum massiliense TaxID=1631346 RepID=UPI000B075354
MKAICNAAVVKTITHGDLEEATVLIDQGKILMVGHNLEIPEGTEIIDAKGGIVTPGIIDVHTHVGLFTEGAGESGVDGNEMTEASTPHVRAIDGINPDDLAFEDARKGGVTTVQIMPGSANVIGGEMAVLKTVGTTVEEMMVKAPSALKVAFGENPKRVYGKKGKMPMTRMGVAAVLREQLYKARTYIEKKKRAQENGDYFEYDLRMEVLTQVVEGKIPMRAHAHRADDMMTAIRIAEEFSLHLTLEHGTEGHKIAKILGEKGVPVAVGPTMSSRSKVELANRSWQTLTALADAGVPISITTDHPVVGIEYLPVTAAIAVREGLSEKVAWEAITINAARHIGIADRVGSIEVGKDADFVIWDGDPFDFRTHVVETMINGEIVYSR